MKIENMKSREPDGGSLAGLFRTASRLMARIYQRHDNAGHAQERVLSIIRRQGRMTQRELMEILDVRSSSLSEVLGKLEGGGFIRRERNPDDRRGFILSAVTPAGNEQPREEAAGGQRREDDFFACLTDGEREQLKIILEKLVESLKRESDDMPRHHRRRRHGGPGKGRGFPSGRGRRMKRHGDPFP